MEDVVHFSVLINRAKNYAFAELNRQGLVVGSDYRPHHWFSDEPSVIMQATSSLKYLVPGGTIVPLPQFNEQRYEIFSCELIGFYPNSPEYRETFSYFYNLWKAAMTQGINFHILKNENDSFVSLVFSSDSDALICKLAS